MGIGAPTAERHGWDGAVVVLGGRESRSQGEGRQRVGEGKEAVIPKDALLDDGALSVVWVGPRARVSGMQAKLDRWAVADPGFRFDDLCNFVADPATLIVAWGRVWGNQGAHSPGVDGLTVAGVEDVLGVPGFLDDLRAQGAPGVAAGPLRR